MSNNQNYPHLEQNPCSIQGKQTEHVMFNKKNGRSIKVKNLIKRQAAFAFIFLVIFLAAVGTVNAQVDRKYTFKEVGWTMNLPSEFTVLSSKEDQDKNESGKKAIEEANGIKADISKTKTLISATKNTYNTFNATITPFNPKIHGSHTASIQNAKDVVYKTFSDKMPDAIIDSASSVQLVDGISFDKFHIRITLKEQVLFNMFLLLKYYKGYHFGISYLYLDENTKEQIETILSNSIFIK